MPTTLKITDNKLKPLMTQGYQLDHLLSLSKPFFEYDGLIHVLSLVVHLNW